MAEKGLRGHKVALPFVEDPDIMVLLQCLPSFLNGNMPQRNASQLPS